MCHVLMLRVDCRHILTPDLPLAVFVLRAGVGDPEAEDEAEHLGLPLEPEGEPGELVAAVVGVPAAVHVLVRQVVPALARVRPGVAVLTLVVCPVKRR